LGSIWVRFGFVLASFLGVPLLKSFAKMGSSIKNMLPGPSHPARDLRQLDIWEHIKNNTRESITSRTEPWPPLGRSTVEDKAMRDELHDRQADYFRDCAQHARDRAGLSSDLVEMAEWTAAAEDYDALMRSEENLASMTKVRPSRRGPSDRSSD
jgi:hypothetical protein